MMKPLPLLLIQLLFICMFGCISVPKAITQYDTLETGKAEARFYMKLKTNLQNSSASLLWNDLGYNKILWSEDKQDQYFKKVLVKVIKPIRFQGKLWQILIFIDSNRAIPGTIKPTIVLTDMHYSLVAWRRCNFYFKNASIEYQGKNAILKVITYPRFNYTQIYYYRLSTNGIELLSHKRIFGVSSMI